MKRSRSGHSEAVQGVGDKNVRPGGKAGALGFEAVWLKDRLYLARTILRVCTPCALVRV